MGHARCTVVNGIDVESLGAQVLLDQFAKFHVIVND
jgi:hypothetical protein